MSKEKEEEGEKEEEEEERWRCAGDEKKDKIVKEVERVAGDGRRGGGGGGGGGAVAENFYATITPQLRHNYASQTAGHDSKISRAFHTSYSFCSLR